LTQINDQSFEEKQKFEIVERGQEISEIGDLLIAGRR